MMNSTSDANALVFTPGLPNESGHYIFKMYNDIATEGYFEKGEGTVTIANMTPPRSIESFITFKAHSGKIVAYAPVK